jgi:BolA family transcriptional regulator, general stress-responsive regulator
MATVAAQLRSRLEAALQPSLLQIEDDSARHHGHAGWRQGGETHFSVVLVSASFDGKSRLDRQRLVHAAAGDLLVERIHALSIKALTPAEAAAAA